MPGEEPSIAEIVQRGTQAALERLFKAGPGKVTAYDPVTNTAFVKPTTARALYSPSDKRTYEELPEIPFVPVLMPRAGGMIVRLPVAVGDTVLLIYCDTSTAEWRETGQEAEPQDARLHGIGYPVAIPGLFPDTKPPSPLDAVDAATKLILGKDGSNVQIVIDANTIKLGKQAADFVALATKVDACFTAIKNIFSGWTPVPNDGGAALKTAWTSGASGIVATGAAMTKAT